MNAVWWIVAFVVVAGGVLYFSLRSMEPHDRGLRWLALAGMIAVIAVVAPTGEREGPVWLLTPLLFVLIPVVADYLGGGKPVVNALVSGMFAVVGLGWTMFLVIAGTWGMWYFLPILVLGVAALASLQPRSPSPHDDGHRERVATR